VLVSRLPADSALVEAQADDPDYAAWVAAQPSSGPGAPRLSEWSPPVELLAAIFDRLGDITSALAALGGVKPGRPQLWPRPLTEVDRARRQERVNKHLSLVAEVKSAQSTAEGD